MSNYTGTISEWRRDDAAQAAARARQQQENDRSGWSRDPAGDIRNQPSGYNGYALSLPVRVIDQGGPYQLLGDLKEVIKQNLMMILLTNPGEKIMDPEFGCGLQHYLFEPNLPAVTNQLEAVIREQVHKYLPFLKLDPKVITTREDDSVGENTVYISIKYFITPLGADDEIILRSNLGEGGFESVLDIVRNVNLQQRMSSIVQGHSHSFDASIRGVGAND